MSWLVRAQLLVLVVAAFAACGEAGSEPDRRSSGSWERLPDPLLSPREGALALWMEGEALSYLIYENAIWHEEEHAEDILAWREEQGI